jgi:hypothetical protein
MADDRPVQALFADADAPNYAVRFRRGWVVQRVGWAAMVVLVAAGVAGFFGSGPASAGRAGAPRLDVEYERFLRLDRPTELAFRVDGGGPTELWLAEDYVHELKIEAISPEPRAVRAGRGRVVFEFDLSGPTNVVFHVRPREVGWLAGQAGVGAPLELRHFVYP